jgi:hypothetical protein
MDLFWLPMSRGVREKDSEDLNQPGRGSEQPNTASCELRFAITQSHPHSSSRRVLDQRVPRQQTSQARSVDLHCRPNALGHSLLSL